MRFGDGSASGDGEIQSLATWAYNERAQDRQTAAELLGRLIHVPGTVWQPLTEVQPPLGSPGSRRSRRSWSITITTTKRGVASGV